MRILHIGYNHRYNDIRIFQKECCSLTKIVNYEVTYLTSNKNCAEVYKGKEKDVNIIVLEVDDGRREQRLVNYLKKVKGIIDELKPDIIHIHEFQLLPLMSYLKKEARVIYDSHEDIPRQLFGDTRNSIKGKILEFFVEKYENYQVKKADFVITATPHIEERFNRIVKNVLTVANYPIMESWNTVNSKKNEKIICYAGGISEQNGIKNVVDAIEKVDGTLMLAGNVPATLKSDLLEREGWKKVKELGYITSQEVKELYKKSSCGMVTYLPVPNSIEALPNKLFEYMAAGVPVIASDFPLWKEIVEGAQCGICVNPESVEEITEAINFILNNSNEMLQMAENGKKAVREIYNWESQEIKLYEVYKCLIEN